MERRHLILFACAALTASACAKSNAESTPPETLPPTEVSDGGAAEDGTTAEKRTPKGSTSTSEAGMEKKASNTRLSAKRPVRKPARAKGGGEGSGEGGGGKREGAGKPRKPGRGGGGGGSDEELVGDNGLLGEVFAIGEIEALPDFSTLGEPAGKIDVLSVDYADGFPGVDGEAFALRFTGSINLVEAGEYQLCLASADGSRLLLEGTLVVDNDGRHAAATVCEVVYLEAGEYALELDYFKGGTNGASLQFLWGRGEAEPAIVPVEVLFRPGA